jgi:hypothetical protein
MECTSLTGYDLFLIASFVNATNETIREERSTLETKKIIENNARRAPNRCNTHHSSSTKIFAREIIGT